MAPLLDKSYSSLSQWDYQFIHQVINIRTLSSFTAIIAHRPRHDVLVLKAGGILYFMTLFIPLNQKRDRIKFLSLKCN